MADDRQSVPDLPETPMEAPDTLMVEGENGRKVFLMKALKDENGEMVATDVIEAATVTARFRNVAERHGRVDLRFLITVPRTLMDDNWQLRFSPVLTAQGKTTRLDSILITGKGYRKAQLLGYQRYRRYVESIITDPEMLIDRFQLENFIRRNIPELYRFKTDSTEVSEREFLSAFGVSGQDAVDHYTIGWLVRRNNRRLSRKDLMFRKLVRAPIITEGVRLDTVMATSSGGMVYQYVHTLKTGPGLRKAEISLSGSIMKQDRLLYTIPRTRPITYYISSLSGLADNRERFITRTISRMVREDASYWIEFEKGGSRVLETLGNNASELERISGNLLRVDSDPAYTLDSITVTASCSPEGSWKDNRRLSQDRSRSVSDYFRGRTKAAFITRSNPENWAGLDALVRSDTVLTKAQKKEYFALSAENDPDVREAMLQCTGGYRRIRESLYPRLRTVRFDFFLHRKGQTKDTVHTTEPDTVYLAGVNALKNMDYEKAVTLLRPYRDYNAALACAAMDYNATALDIISGLEMTPRVNYLLAIIHSRRGEYNEAVKCYLDACRADGSFVHRGNLDPEISELIRKYGLTP